MFRIFRCHLRVACLVLVCALAVGARPASAADRSERDFEFVEAVTWGSTSATYADMQRLGRARWLDEQLTLAPAKLPEPVQRHVDAMRVSKQSAFDIMSEITSRRARFASLEPGERSKREAEIQHEQNLILYEASSRSLIRAIHAPDQLRERMTWFWSNHFNVHGWHAWVRVLVGDYEQSAIRPRSLGKFRDILGAVTRHPAMLRYLDNSVSAAGHLNENHARELLERHTLGADGGYTQKDVEELARIMTGHRFEEEEKREAIKPELRRLYSREGLTAFNPAFHDFGDKVFLGHRIAGSGAQELDIVLDILARHPATARHVARRLAMYFMSDDPPQAVVEAMSQEFLRTDGSIAAMLGLLLRSPDFEAALATRIKDPMRYAVSAVRLAYEERFVIHAVQLVVWIRRLGQGPFSRSTPDGFPLASTAWLGSGQLATRFDFAKALGWAPMQLLKEGATTPEPPAFAAPRNALYYAAWKPRLSKSTLDALDKAGSQQEWNTLFLASPEFMQGGVPK